MITAAFGERENTAAAPILLGYALEAICSVRLNLAFLLTEM